MPSAVLKLSVLLLLLALLPPPSTAQQSSPNGPRDGYPYSRFSPSMAIIIAILIAALCLMAFFSIYIRNCAQANSPTVRLGAAAIRSRLNAARGLDAETIGTFPTMVYSEVKGLKIGKSALECAVCLNEFEDDETLRLIPKCDHVFHPDCIDAWLASHTTCPVCRANLVPQPGDPVGQPAEFSQPEVDLEAQNDAVSEPEMNATVDAAEPEVINVDKRLNRNRARVRRSRSGRPPKFPRSHSTGHSIVQPGENTDRFTLRLPADVRKQIMERELSRSSSMVLARGGSSRRVNRAAGEGSSRGKYFRRPEILDRLARSERWSFNRMPSFLRRAPSVTSPSIKSPKVAAIDGGEASFKKLGESSRPPV